MIRYTVVVNPIAGNGRGARILPVLRQRLDAAGAPYEILQTSRAGEAVELSRDAKGEVIVAVGGDGTINEVANGMAADKVLGIIPAGSGNDLIKSLGIPSKPVDALECLLNGKIVEIDLGRVQCGKKSVEGQENPGTDRLFTNGVGIGFDASVAIKKGEISYLKGTAVYVLAVLQTLRTYKAPTFSLRTNGYPATEKQLLLAAIGNGRCAGGGFYLTPEADPSDGLLDVTLIDNVPIRTILHLMPRVMRGKHLGHPVVKSLRSNHIVMESDTPFNVHADGEIVGRSVNHVEVNIMEKRLKVLSGKKLHHSTKS